MKKYLALFLAMIMALSLVACGAKEEPTPEDPATNVEEPATDVEEPAEKTEDFKVAFLPPWLRDDFYKDVYISAQMKADELGVELIFQDPNGEDAKILELMENFVAMGADAIAVEPCLRDAMIPIFEKYQEQGIEIVCWGTTLTDPPEGIPDVALQFDYAQCGRELGKLVEEYVTETGFWDGETPLRTALITLPTSVIIGVPIINEASNYLLEKGIIEIVAEQDGKADRNYAMGVMENILTAQNGNIDLILGFNYDACIGAVQACEAYGLTEEDCLAFSQLWGTEAFQHLEDNDSMWKGGVAYAPTSFGSGAIQACYDLLTGVECEPTTVLEATLLTPENIDTFDWESIIEARENLK